MRIFYDSLRRAYLFIRVQKPVSGLFGPVFKRSLTRIEIDITYDCNLRCINCNRSCRQAPSGEKISIGQIEKFIKESADNKVKWERIRVTGGEPALHPEIMEILNLMLKYKRDYSSHLSIELVTNGYGKKVNAILPEVPGEVVVKNSAKRSEIQEFSPFNVAPCDLIRYRFSDYASGCPNMTECGMGLTPFGYYPCAVMGSIDRVFGLDIGRKKLPPKNDLMRDQLASLCRYCGRFWNGMPWEKTVTKEIISPIWKEYYSRYTIKKPMLTLY